MSCGDAGAGARPAVAQYLRVAVAVVHGDASLTGAALHCRRQACFRGYRTRSRVVHRVRAELERAADGTATVIWRRPHTLCAPAFVDAPAGPPAQACDEDAKSPVEPPQDAVPQDADLDARRAALQAELAWAEAALASRRAMLRDAQRAQHLET